MSPFLKYAREPFGPSAADNPAATDAGPDIPFRLRVTLGEMPSEDAFLVTLPSSFARLPLGELLAQAFPEEPERQAPVRAGFDLRENPDLPEMYGALVDVFRAWRQGRCALRFFAESGPELEPSDAVRQHIRSPRPAAATDVTDAALHLVVEQRFTPLDYAVRKGYAKGRVELLERLQADMVLYFIGEHGFRLEADPKSEADRRLLPIAQVLLSKNLIATAGDARAYELTEEGQQLLANTFAEAESYVDRYDLFGDVLFDRESGATAFGSGRGEDLRVQAYEAEGLDPVRVVFLMRLYASGPDDFGPDWRESVHDEEFFEGLLAPVADRDEIDEALLEEVIEAGLAYLEERGEEARALALQRELIGEGAVRGVEQASAN